MDFEGVQKAVEESFNPRRILIVEDDETTRNAIADLVRTSGMIPLTAGDAETGWERFENEGPFHIVMIDLKLPGIDGIDMLGKIREVNSEVPVVIFTGYLESERLRELPRYNWVTLVSKPFTNVKLDTVLSSIR